MGEDAADNDLALSKKQASTSELSCSEMFNVLSVVTCLNMSLMPGGNEADYVPGLPA
jgi:hypothetical protein